MELRMEKDRIVQALQITNLAVNSKTALPILSNLLWEIDEKYLTMTATDLEIFIRHRVRIDSEIKTRFTAPAKRLKEIIASLPDGGVNLDFNPEKNKLNINAERITFSINTLPANDFPQVQITDKQKTITLPQPVLKQLLARTIFAVSRNDLRQVITGLCLEIKDKKLTLAGTDGRRLAMSLHDLDSGIEDFKCILPAKAVRPLLSILQPEGEVKLYPDKTLVGFELNETILGVRLIEGRFPEYRKVIPQETKIEFNLEVENLIKATKRAAIFTKEGSGIKYSFGNNKLTLTSNTPEIGEAKEELELESSREMEIVLNPRYILEALQNLNTEKVVLGLNDKDSPALIEPLNDGDYLQLIMPLRTE